MSRIVRALALGDVMGQPGCRALFFELPQLIKKLKIDFVVANGENADNGFGITPEIVTRFFQAGVDVITSGNHIWQKRDIDPVLENNPAVLRPANYAPGVPGRGWTVIEKKGFRWGVINLQGRERMPSTDCPFREGREILAKHGSEADIWIVDFHAESAREKEALGFFLDGKADLVLGTHTHVQTADEKILPEGTAYITDLGMCGPKESVIGSKPEISLQRSRTQLPLKMEVLENEASLMGVIAEWEMDPKKISVLKRLDTGRDDPSL